MPKYRYTAQDEAGELVRGEIDGETASGVGLALLDRGLLVTDLDERKGILQFEITKKRIKRRDLMEFSRQLAVFLRAGIPVLDALGVILEETPPKSLLATVLRDMVDALRAGATFTQAARGHAEAFPKFYLGVIESAEYTGNLDSALDEVASYIDRDLEARRKIQSALFYPACVFLMSIITVIVMTTFVLPRFETFFHDLHAKLPLPTRMLLGLTHFIKHDGVFLAAGVIVLLGAAIGLMRTEKGRSTRDTIILRLPVLGELVRTAIIERFCRTLASMVRTGVNLPDALTVTADGTNNVVYKTGLSEVREAMLRGEGLAGPIARTELFPGAARQMIRIGEETGTLDQQLETSAQYFGRDLDFKIGRFTNLFEPAVIIFMGVVVGFVAVALISAMYGIFRQVNVP
jgi:type IV pilus assembly protein PilC